MPASVRKPLAAAAAALALAMAPVAAHAQGIPVIDAAAVANLIQQVAYWQRQVAAMALQLQQLQATHAAMTGARGMEALAAQTLAQRNYLPPDDAGLRALAGGSPPGPYAGLAAQVQAAMAANAMLAPGELAAMGPAEREAIERGRRTGAVIGTMARAAYQNTSLRFAALQVMIDAIARAADPKAMYDLQGRIAAEQAMLANEQAKLQALHQVAQAEQWAREQRLREAVVRGHGSFATRFQPTP